MRLAALLLLCILAGCGAQTPSEASIRTAVAAELQASASVAPTRTPVPTPAGGAWRVSRETSSFDDTETVVLSLTANEPIKGWPDITYTPALLLRCKEQRLEAYIATGMPAAIVTGLLKQARARIRVDDGEARPIIMDRASDDKALFFREPEATIEELGRADRLLFGFTPFNASPVETSFDLAGLPDLLPDLYGACEGVAPTAVPPTATPAAVGPLEQPFFSTPKGPRRLATEAGGERTLGRICAAAQVELLAREYVDDALWYQVEVIEAPECKVSPPLAAVGDTGWLGADELNTLP